MKVGQNRQFISFTCYWRLEDASGASCSLREKTQMQIVSIQEVWAHPAGGAPRTTPSPGSSLPEWWKGAVRSTLTGSTGDRASCSASYPTAGWGLTRTLRLSSLQPRRLCARRWRPRIGQGLEDSGADKRQMRAGDPAIQMSPQSSAYTKGETPPCRTLIWSKVFITTWDSLFNLVHNNGCIHIIHKPNSLPDLSVPIWTPSVPSWTQFLGILTLETP